MMFHSSQPTAAGRNGFAGSSAARLRFDGRRGVEFLVCSLLVLLLLGLAVVWPSSLRAASGRVLVTDVRYWSLGDVTRIAVETTGEFTYKYNNLPNPPRFYFDIHNARQKLSSDNMHSLDVNDGLVKQIRVSQNQDTVTRIVLDLDADIEVTSSQLANPDRLMIEIRRKGTKPDLSQARKLPPPTQSAATQTAKREPVKAAETAKSEPEPVKMDPVKPAVTAKATPPPAKEEKAKAAPPPVAPPPTAAVTSAPETPSPVEKSEPKQVAAAKPAPPPQPEAEEEVYEDVPLGTPAKQNSGGTHSLTRVLGLKLGRVVIDPGHGGRDTGTIGPSGLREKEITLDVSKRLAELIEERMGSEVVLTRNADVSVPLDARAKIANEKQADLFISIHVNASRYRNVDGVETFYLNFTRSRADLEVAARENAGSNRSIHELSNLVQKIAMDDKVQESRDLASSVQTSVYALAAKHYSKARNRGVKKAPMVVLIGAQMPSVLVELGFISNAREEKLMKTKDFRQELAEALYTGISKYASSLSHFQVAQTKALDEE